MWCQIVEKTSRKSDPDINTIENLFHLLSIELEKQALESNLTKDNFKNFVSWMQMMSFIGM